MRYFWAFIFLFAPCLTNAQNNSKADSLFTGGDFARAALEYEREIFYGDDINKALLGRIRCFKKMGQFDKAAEELLRIRLFALNQAQMADYFYEKILCNYLSGAFIEAQRAIDEMYLNLPDSALSHNTLLLQTFVYNELQQWDKARESALIYAHGLSAPQKEETIAAIEKMYAAKNLPKLKKEKVARRLAFVPGLAHIYTGNFGEGAVSFLLVSTAFAFGINEIWHGYYFTAYFVGVGIFRTTYFGGMKRASVLLQKHNDEAVRLFNNQVREKLLDF